MKDGKYVVKSWKLMEFEYKKSHPNCINIIDNKTNIIWNFTKTMEKQLPLDRVIKIVNNNWLGYIIITEMLVGPYFEYGEKITVSDNENFLSSSERYFIKYEPGEYPFLVTNYELPTEEDSITSVYYKYAKKIEPLKKSTSIYSLFKEIIILKNGSLFWQDLMKYPEINKKCDSFKFNLIENYISGCSFCELYRKYVYCTNCPLYIINGNCKYFNELSQKSCWCKSTNTNVDRQKAATKIMFAHHKDYFKRIKLLQRELVNEKIFKEIKVLMNGYKLWKDLFGHSKIKEKTQSRNFDLVENYENKCSLCEFFKTCSLCPLNKNDSTSCKFYNTSDGWKNCQTSKDRSKNAMSILLVHMQLIFDKVDLLTNDIS